MNRNKCIINLNNLIYNLDQIKEHTGKKIIAVVKADAYGHGAVEIAEAIEDKIDYLAVACFEEAVELRNNGIVTPILILGHTESDKFEEASKKNITVTIHDFSQLDVNTGGKLKVHIKIDTGMNRIGFNSLDDAKRALSIMMKTNYYDIEGIFTHYATADCDKQFYLEQRHKFEEIVESLDYEFKYIHSSSSAASINYGEDLTNAVRPGIILYGIKPSYDIDFSLKPVLSLYSKIIHLKKISAGERIGYGNSYIVKEDMVIATVPIGYGDGWLRRNATVPVYINGQYCEIVGRICMDMMMVKVDETAKLGDEVELIGNHISADDVASKTDTISYEVVCNLGKRLKRNYVK